MTSTLRSQRHRSRKNAGLVLIKQWVPKDREAQVLAAIEAATSGVDPVAVEREDERIAAEAESAFKQREAAVLARCAIDPEATRIAGELMALAREGK